MSLEKQNARGLVICGPTACGKSDLADLAGHLLSERYSSYSPVVVVDSMQVYKELPVITNQQRRRPAELTGVVSVLEEWTMARHRLACDEITSRIEVPFVLDAGTGMYLNAVILDIPIAPRVSKETRRRAEAMSSKATNTRRKTREIELEISGYGRRRSIWDGELRKEVEILYIRPDREELDSAIEMRSLTIAREGLDEAAKLVRSFPEGIPNRSVRDSIGVKELIAHSMEQISFTEAEQRILIRTRRLARRQVRWFDKLTATLRGRANILISKDSYASEAFIHDYVRRYEAYYS